MALSDWPALEFWSCMALWIRAVVRVSFGMDNIAQGTKIDGGGGKRGGGGGGRKELSLSFSPAPSPSAVAFRSPQFPARPTICP